MTRQTDGGINRRVAISGVITVGAGAALVQVAGVGSGTERANGPALAARPPLSPPLLVNTGMMFKPEDFGARGDGQINDTAAFRRMAAAVNQAGGGRIVLRPTTYLVGEQGAGAPDSRYAFAPRAVLRLTGCRQMVSIEGNGAVLRCAPNLRYGTFDRATGQPINLPLPNTAPGTLAAPYDHMVVIEECRGAVAVADLELDGSIGAHRLGGPWGDTGWQIACDGLYLRGNHGDEVVHNLYTHHHARDGLMIAGLAKRAVGTRKAFTGVRSEWNGRQGCSLIGGRGYIFADCRFAHTGRGRLSSAPGAGFDIEAESAPIRNIRFERCVFDDNVGCGLVADSGDSADVSAVDCRFIGTVSWSLWPNKPGFRFDRCEMVGACVRFFGSSDPVLATRFFDCIFTDATARSPTGKVYRNGPMANAAYSENVLFARCRFDALQGAQLPWSTAVIFEDCTMRQIGGEQAYPRGVFRGDNRIQGNVDIAASRVKGRLVLNDRLVPLRS